MGVAFPRIVEFFDAAYRPGPRPSVLDIGCSNVHSIDREALQAFVTRHNPNADPARLATWARYVAAGGLMDPEIGGINGAWLGDVLERAGFRYEAFDIFEGYKTTLFDLNSGDLPPERRAAYDYIFNFGTTEHLLGQFNAFKVIHEALAVGGVVYHDLPMTGHLDHGFVNYNPMLLVSLAEANGYEILRLSFDGGLAGESVAAGLVSRYGHRPYFQQLQADWLHTPLPTASVSLIARKTNDGPFRASLETSTTVGMVPDSIGDGYGAEGLSPHQAQARAREQVDAVLRRLGDPELTLEEMNEAYKAFVGSGLTSGFPLSLELRILDRMLEQMPDEPGLLARRPEAARLLREDRPLLKVAEARRCELDGTPRLLFDGVEAQIALVADEAAALRQILAAYLAYDENSAVELFPKSLEARALEQLYRAGAADHALLIRLGRVMAEVTPTLQA